MCIRGGFELIERFRNMRLIRHDDDDDSNCKQSFTIDRTRSLHNTAKIILNMIHFARVGWRRRSWVGGFICWFMLCIQFRCMSTSLCCVSNLITRSKKHIPEVLSNLLLWSCSRLFSSKAFYEPSMTSIKLISQSSLIVSNWIFRGRQ